MCLVELLIVLVMTVAIPQVEVPPLVEAEWAQAWLDHQANPPPHIHIPIQFSRMGSGVEQWRELVASHFPADQVDHALRIMACESGGNPNALNLKGSSARGLFQILASLWAPMFGVSYEDFYDPEINVRLARRIWDQSGWEAWSCHR